MHLLMAKATGSLAPATHEFTVPAPNAAFVVATIGIVAWFLNYRIQMKEITAAAYPPHDERKGRNPDEN